MRFAARWLLRIAAVFIILVLAGPEIGIGVELLAITELLGAELFVVSFLAGFRLLLDTHVLTPVRRLLERIDPFFFIPTTNQIALVPGMVAHVVPGLVVTYIGWLVFVSVPTEA